MRPNHRSPKQERSATNGGGAAGVAASIVLALLVAACGSAAPVASPSARPSSAPASGGPVAASPSVAPSESTATTSWLSPAAGDKVRTAVVKFSASFSGPVAPTAVTFTALSGSATKTACAAKATAAGSWSCEANLLTLGIAPGPVTLGLRATDAKGARDAAEPRQVTYAVAPLAPVGVSFKESGGSPTTRTVSWKGTPLGATSVTAYGFTPCVAPPTSTGKPCIVKGTPLAPSMIFVIKSGPANAHSVSWSEVGEDIGGAVGVVNGNYYNALLLVAENQYGRSRFIIVSSATSCYQCVY